MRANKKRRLVQYGRLRRATFEPLVDIPDADTDTNAGSSNKLDADASKHHSADPGGRSAMFFPSTDKIDHSQQPLPPRKPTSQKEATMAAEPDAEKVEMFMAFVTNVDRHTAVRYLKAKHNDVEAAVNAMFDGEDISKAETAHLWDEGAWSTDREGNTSEQYLHPLGASSAAATRPNSPASSLARQNMHPTSKTEEDEDFAKALEMSQADLPAQEMGRIGADGQETKFGPAMKQKEYDERNWAMVPFSLQDNTDEVIPDLDAPDRVNEQGAPRLLKHLPEGDYISSFLTICHSIVGAKEALLMREHLQSSYGQDFDWWRGHAVALPRIVHIEDGTPAEPDRDPQDELIAEVQRLMAFLSASERSYASVAPLTQTEVLKNSNPHSTRSGTFLELFIQRWIAATSDKNGDQGLLRKLFTTTVGTNAADGMDTPDMNLVDLPVSIGAGSKLELFERLDELLWDADGDLENMSDNYIEQPADVVVMRVYQQSALESQLRIEVPPVFFIDKYMPQNIEATRATRIQMAKQRKRIATIEEIEKRLKTWRHPRNNSTIEAKALLTHTLGHFSGQTRAEVFAADKSYSASPDSEAPLPLPPHYSTIAQKLEKIIADIDEKLGVLAEEKEKTRKAIADMSRSPSPGMHPDELRHRYTLRGVATKPNITYVLAATDPAPNDLIQLDDSTPNGMQWWRMEYEVSVSGSGAKIIKTPTADYDVLRAVELEHRSALLVYASDRIQSTSLDKGPLPEALQDFIDRDNATFRQELATERAKPPAYSSDSNSNNYSNRGEIRPSIEVDRRGSMDSTRAEGSRSPTPPTYPNDIDDVDMFSTNHPVGYGLGYDMNKGRPALVDADDDEPPVHEIRLPEDEGIGMGTDVEMMSTNVPPQTLHYDGVSGLDDDTAVSDAVSQDQGVGGAGEAVHIEDSTSAGRK